MFKQCNSIHKYIQTYIHTYIFINPRNRMTIQDAKTVSDEIEKGAMKNK